jgi:acyl dehydratase
MESANDSIPLSEFNGFPINSRIDLGVTSFTEKEIIDFATLFDPLEFHINPQAARKSYFGGIIASGPHIFNYVHRTKWIPLFKDSVICGIEVKSWKFLKPIYPDKVIQSFVTICDIKPNPEKKVIALTWFYEFLDELGELVQTLEMTILHKLPK